MDPDAAATVRSGPDRVRIFVDFWNLQLTMNERERAATGSANFRFDWSKLPSVLVQKAAEKCAVAGLAYEGMHVYASYDPRAHDDGLKRWLLTWLDRQPGVQVVLKERRP